MLQEKTMDREIRHLRNGIANPNISEAAFLEGALFALEWMKSGIRSSSPSRFIEWRREGVGPYDAHRESVSKL